MMEEHDILDNGGIMYTVEISQKRNNTEKIGITIFDENHEEKYKIHVDNPEQILIGRSVPSSIYIGDSKYDGNTILICENPAELSYIYISEKVYRFKAESKIIEYHSPVGYNEVPYPYAIDVNNTAYIMNETVLLRNFNTSTYSESDGVDPCSLYYKLLRENVLYSPEHFTTELVELN